MHNHSRVAQKNSLREWNFCIKFTIAMMIALPLLNPVISLASPNLEKQLKSEHNYALLFNAILYGQVPHSSTWTSIQCTVHALH